MTNKRGDNTKDEMIAHLVKCTAFLLNQERQGEDMKSRLMRNTLRIELKALVTEWLKDISDDELDQGPNGNKSQAF